MVKMGDPSPILIPTHELLPLILCPFSLRKRLQTGWVGVRGHSRSNTNPEEILDLYLHSQIFRHNVEVELTIFNKQKLIYVSESRFLF